MEITFDPAKDAINREKHGIALSRTVEMTDTIFIEDHRSRSDASASMA